MSQNENQVLDIKTFGTFSVTVGDISVTDTLTRSGKVWMLFKYIITNRHSPIPTDRLIEVLWPEDDVEKPINALFTLVYRLRNLLNLPFDQKQNFIIFHHNCYVWNKDAPYTLDSERFEQLCETVEKRRGDPRQLMETGLAAFDLYRGGYLPELSEDWVVPVGYSYKRLYASLVLTMSRLYAEAGDYDAIIKLCGRAIEIDAYEESHHIALIDALIRLGQPSQALAHYDFITYMLQKDLGVMPSSALLALRDRMYQQSDGRQKIQSIKAAMSERSEQLPGAFFCDLDAFRHIYRLEARMSSRTDRRAFLVEMSVKLGGSNGDGELLTEAMTVLRRTALFTLRRNDVITQYSRAQLLLLLQSGSPESCEEVIKRIEGHFTAEIKGKFFASVEHSAAHV